MKQITTPVGDIFADVRPAAENLWAHWGDPDKGFVTVTTSAGNAYDVKGTNQRTSAQSPTGEEMISWLPSPAGVIFKGPPAPDLEEREIRDAVIAGLNANLGDDSTEVIDAQAEAVQNQLAILYSERATAEALLLQINASIGAIE